MKPASCRPGSSATAAARGAAGRACFSPPTDKETGGCWPSRRQAGAGGNDRAGEQPGHGRSNVRLIAKDENGVWVARPEVRSSLSTGTKFSDLELLELAGRVPLPHYIRGGEMEAADTQATKPSTPASRVPWPRHGRFALQRGSAAPRKAPACNSSDSRCTSGWTRSGRSPLRRWPNIRCMPSAARSTSRPWPRLRACRAQGGRIVAVGTTSMRVLESAAAGGELKAWHGETRLFIRPPYEFRAVDALLTNFHLPRTTLLVLVRRSAATSSSAGPMPKPFAKSIAFTATAMRC